MKTHKRMILPVIAMALSTAIGYAQKDNVSFANTIKINEGDSPALIVEKAAHVIPTKNQLAALENEYIAFVHFGPNTFTRKEWGNGFEDPKIFDLKTLDTDQWCEAMKAGGMKMVLLTVKHHDGFCIWQSRYTKHGIMSTNFRDGKGDILKDLSESCHKYGLKLGIYLSPADLYQIENPNGLYGNLSKYTKRTIPREVPGRPFKNKTKFEFVVDDYNEYFLNQLFEVLTEYGQVDEVWFDGAHPKRKGGQTYHYLAWKELIHKLAPKAVIFGREDVRWCGNEAGGTRDTEWNVVPFQENPDTMTHFADMTNTDLGSRAELAKGKYLHYQQAETNTSIREGWFYRDDTHQKVRSADDVFDIYERAVGGNSTFLLNIPPNREGRFSDEDVQVLKETGKRIKETYETSLLKKAKGPKALLDNDNDTYIKVTKPIVISMKEPVTMNRLLLQEAIAKQGERIEKHEVDAWVDGQWKKIASATNVGYKRILRFPQITTDKIRIRVIESRLTPTLSTVSAHFYQSRPPQLTYVRDMDGNVTIKPLKHAFGWKPHGEDTDKNLNAGFKIYYTTDGSEPSTDSKLFTLPFPMGNSMLKAVAVLNEEKGAVMKEQLGIVKNSWKLIDCSGSVNKHQAELLFDENSGSYWMEEKADKHFFSLDLGKEQRLKGFAYTPQTEHSKGMMAKGKILTSKDGKNWELFETFEFGNLINDPSKRFHYFKKQIETKYIRVEATEISANGSEISIAEFDLF